MPGQNRLEQDLLLDRGETMAEWDDLMPGENGMKLDSEGMIEREAVRRILVKTELSKEIQCETFTQLVMATGFPLQLVVHKFRTKDLDDIDIDMMLRPTKSALIVAVDDIFAQYPDVQQCDLGMVFPWMGHGGLHVLTNDTSLPYTLGASGRFWRIGGMYYLLEHIDSFIERLGPSDEW